MDPTNGNRDVNKEISKVLFICSYNAGRPQMAEGYLNTRYGDRHNARSAGFRSSRMGRSIEGLAGMVMSRCI